MARLVLAVLVVAVPRVCAFARGPRSLARSAVRSTSDATSDAAASMTRGDDLTLRELAHRFADVRAHFRKSGTLPQAKVVQNMLRTRLTDLRLDRARRGTSAVHGDGVFATRALAKGELITLYPGDALLVWADGDKSPSKDIGVLFGDHASDREPRRILGDLARGYELGVDSFTSLVGDPELAADPSYLGHYCNDGAAFFQMADAAAYEAETTARYNAEFHGLEGCHYAAVATRDVAEGEEILVSYGTGYWLSRCADGGAASDAAYAKSRETGAHFNTEVQRTLLDDARTLDTTLPPPVPAAVALAAAARRSAETREAPVPRSRAQRRLDSPKAKAKTASKPKGGFAK